MVAGAGEDLWVQMKHKMSVAYFCRKAGKGTSLETVFDVVRANLPPEIVTTSVFPCRFESKGMFRRVANVIEAGQRQEADINHIAGDVLYLAYLLDADRTVVTIPDATVLTRLDGTARRIVEELWYRGPERRATVVTTISRAARSELCAILGWSQSRVRVVHVAVSPVFAPAPRRQIVGTTRLLQVGTASNKNLDRLVAALEGLDVHLAIVGKLTPNQEAMLEQARIPWANMVNVTEEKVAEAYRETDIVVFPSTNEGFGMPILEAQTVERPVLTSNCSSMPEVAGSGAHYVDPYSVESIRNGVVALLGSESLRDTIVKEGRANRRKFDPKAIAQEYLDIYREVWWRRGSG